MLLGIRASCCWNGGRMDWNTSPDQRCACFECTSLTAPVQSVRTAAVDFLYQSWEESHPPSWGYVDQSIVAPRNPNCSQGACPSSPPGSTWWPDGTRKAAGVWRGDYEGLTRQVGDCLDQPRKDSGYVTCFIKAFLSTVFLPQAILSSPGTWL
jgi:hypothetical protein